MKTDGSSYRQLPAEDINEEVLQMCVRLKGRVAELETENAKLKASLAAVFGQKPDVERYRTKV